MIKSLLTKLKGALGTAVTWAVAWAMGGFALITLLFVVDGGMSPYWEVVRPITLLAGMSGFIAGTVFSLVLAIIHRRRQVGDLKPSRMALWGALAGVLIPTGFLGLAVSGGATLPPHLAGMMLAGLAGLGAATAAGTVKLAQAGTTPLEAPASRERLGPGK